MLRGDRAETPPRVVEIAAAEGCLGQAKLKLGQEVIGREKALEAIAFRAVALSDDQRGRPLGFETLEILGSFFDMDFDGNEMLVDELTDLLVGVNLGVQPGASPSHRSGTEVEQQHFLLSLGQLQPLIRIAYPLNVSHSFTP